MMVTRRVTQPSGSFISLVDGKSKKAKKGTRGAFNQTHKHKEVLVEGIVVGS